MALATRKVMYRGDINFSNDTDVVAIEYTYNDFKDVITIKSS